MTIFLVPHEDNTDDPSKTAKQIDRAVHLFRKARGQHPLILTLTGYDVYAIPGTVDVVEPDKDGKIKLDFDNIFDIMDMMNEQVEQ